MRCIYLYFLPTTIIECGSIGLLSSTDYQSDADYLSGTFLSSKMSGNRKTIHQFVLAVVTALVLCAVCVGGVSGAVFEVSTEQQLRNAVGEANENGEEDRIIITDDITFVYYRTSDDDMPTPINIYSEITIEKVEGTSVTVKSQYSPTLSTGDFTATDYTVLDSYTLFVINNGGELTISGYPDGTDSDGTFLEFTTNYNGRAFDIKSGGSLVMNEGVRIINCGYTDKVAEYNNGGAIYVRNGGSFTMNGGLLSGNKAGAGGAICVDSTSPESFVMNGGQIEDNEATLAAKDYWLWKVDGYGGGVWLASANAMTWNGGDITGNRSPEPDNDSDQDIYCESGGSVTPPQNTDGLVVRIVNGNPIYYDFIYEAYSEIVSNSLTKDTIYIRGDFSQKPYTEWIDGVSYSILDTVEISNRDISIMPYGDTSSGSITLDLTDQMFTVGTGGSLIISGNNAAVITVINTRESSSEESDNGGFVSVNGGDLTIADGVLISGVNAVNGGAVYLESGSVTLSGDSSITGCTATENGAAVYVAGGTFTVEDSASVDASNDVYLASGQVITAKYGYQGTIGEITLPEYIDGTRVVYIGSDTTSYPDQFIMNQDGITNGLERVLEIDSQSPQYMVLVIPDYDIVIPPTVTIDGEEGTTGSLEVQAALLNIPKKASVLVTVDSMYDFTLAYLHENTGIVNPSIFLRYELRESGNLISEGGEVASFTMEKPDMRTLTVNILDSPLYSGEYVDTLTFTIRYDSGTNN